MDVMFYFYYLSHFGLFQYWILSGEQEERMKRIISLSVLMLFVGVCYAQNIFLSPNKPAVVKPHYWTVIQDTTAMAGDTSLRTFNLVNDSTGAIRTKKVFGNTADFADLPDTNVYSLTINGINFGKIRINKNHGIYKVEQL